MMDIISALLSFLKADTAVAALADTRIYAAELPRAEIESMPQKIAVLRYAGGVERNRFLPIAEPRIDILSFGETYHEAGKLDRAIYAALKALNRETVDNVLLHGIALSGGPLMLRDSDTGSPYQARSITVTADERSTA